MPRSRLRAVSLSIAWTGDNSMISRLFCRNHRATDWRFCPNGFEILERRELLSGTPPTVVKVEVASTEWSEAFVDYLQTFQLGADGYAIPVGSSAQSASLTWTNLDQIIITFSEDVHVDAADLSLSGINTTAYEFVDFHYDPIDHLATWTLGTPLDKDRLRLDLDANGADPVRDLDENILDGEWTNNVSTVSGNGTAGGDFEFNFNVLPTDVNNTGNITSYDYVYIRQLDGKSTTSWGYIAKRDIDGSRLIDSNDWQEALDRALEALPSGSPAGTNNDAPTTSGFNRVQINDAAVDVAISLSSGTDDAEEGGSGLTYTILSNSNPGLFDTASINPTTNELIVNAASGATGRATITVFATDAGGLSVTSTVTVDVNRDNIPPQIMYFTCANVGYGTYVVSGVVADGDDDVSDFIVEFYGVFGARASVNEDGEFLFAIILDPEAQGMEYAMTHDRHGAASNEPFATIGNT
jgi:hypothetical protein